CREHRHLFAIEQSYAPLFAPCPPVGPSLQCHVFLACCEGGLFFFLFVSNVSARLDSMRKPNLIFFLTDQQRADTMACYGNHRVHAPNLNKLAAESAVFEGAYVTQPLCTPSRASLFTGTWPHTNGCIRK